MNTEPLDKRQNLSGPRDPEICKLFEEFLKTMDTIMGGGDTVNRFRDRYKKLTGKKVALLGE